MHRLTGGDLCGCFGLDLRLGLVVALSATETKPKRHGLTGGQRVIKPQVEGWLIRPRVFPQHQKSQTIIPAPGLIGKGCSIKNLYSLDLDRNYVQRSQRAKWQGSHAATQRYRPGGNFLRRDARF